MAQAVLSVRMDKREKTQFDTFCAAAGMNASAAAFKRLMSFSRPLSIGTDYKKELRNALEEK
jgi:hypothetical protein